MSMPALDAERPGKHDLAAVVALRRRLHSHPELGLDNPITQRQIVSALHDVGISDLVTGTGCSSVVATVSGGRPGPVLLLRADTDALPITERSGLGFASQVPGVAHACGHDAHVAMLVGAARMIAARAADLAGSVRFVFQPGEEGHGGAARMIDEGLLDRASPADAAFALHVTPSLPSGVVATRPGTMFAAADIFEVTLRGAGGHAASRHLARDPMPAVADLVTTLLGAIPRAAPPFTPVVVTVGRIGAGTVGNVIPDEAVISGTLRAVDEDTRSAAWAVLERVCRGVAQAHDVTVEIRRTCRHPPVVNDPGFTGLVQDAARAVAGPGRAVLLPTPVMAGEDFGCLLERVPGTLAVLGACPTDLPDPATAPACHAADMRIDEDALATGVALHAAVAAAFLRPSTSIARLRTPTSSRGSTDAPAASS
ncbi:M20 family metallopeptidase [Frankia sp. CiP3]|uniref:M20 metallopeptidase family protein n=1 Tax=Frankia sp. CiP3 TaxID=2880971 RepID=UPI001EF64186|nr:M20 family metallopeptidase [Frankia sp. CiP3]